ncbi:MAG: PAS domain-containing protein [Piscinibacter sp.]|nr:PAS domain-containing protein [Piscinibacter sp.]
MHQARPVAPAASRWVLVVGIALALAIMLALLAEIHEERERQVEQQLERNELFARVLEDHVTRSVESTRLALSSVAAAAAAGGAEPLAAKAFATELSSLPQLRALAVLDEQGRVLASSAPRDVGAQVDLARLGPLPAPGADRLGPYLAARGFADLVPGAAATVPAGVGTLPLLRRASGRDGRALLLVALLHAEGWSSHMGLVLNDASTLGVLMSYDGQVLAATDSRRTVPGRPIPDAARWRERLAARDHDGFVGPGPAGHDQVVAYRAARRLPLVLLVDRARADVVAQRHVDEITLLSGGAVVALFVLLASTIAARSLRAREAAREQVARSERELSLIVGSVHELLFRTDASGVLTFVNARWDGATDPIGRTFASLALPSDAAGLAQLFNDDDGGAPRSVQARLRDAQGSPGGRRFDISVTPLREQGRLLGFAGSAVDITDRWVAQQQLQAQLDFNELLLAMVPIPVAMLDAAGCYVTVNRAWEQFAGRLRRDVVGRAARDFQTPEDAQRHGEVDRELLALGGSRRYEAGFVRADGTRADLLISKVAVPGEDGRASGILAAFMDVTELRHAERATLEARDAAEEASRAKSEFIANISHELRTPLQSIIGFSELGMVRGRAHEKLAAMFTDIHASGRRMLALVNDLLDVAKIESTVGTFHLERTDLRALLREVIRELDPLLAPRQLRIDARLGEAPLVAKVDPLRFQQAIRNILANAIKFCARGHAIDVLAEATVDGEAHIAVRDRGPGIPPAELETIFEAFVQSTQTKDGSGGTGLGLAICRKIVMAHGGRVHAENAAGGGSVFHIHLPLRGFADTQPADELL